LLSSVNGVHRVLGCDLVDLLYEGDPNTGQWRGAYGPLGQKYAYLMTLINEAYILVSSYYDVSLDEPSAYKAIK